MTIGNTILSLLYKHDISQKQMAIDLGLAPSTLNGYINNRREPDYDTLIRFAQYFHVSCDFLLGNPSPDSSENSCADKNDSHLTLNKQEIKLLNTFQSLTPDQMELVMAQIQLMHKQNMRKTDPGKTETA